MPKFDRRKMLEKTAHIFQMTGKQMRMYLRINPITPTTPAVPFDLLAASEEPAESSADFRVVGFFGKFEEEINEYKTPGGREKHVKGMITVPFLYRALLAQADYIDPYGDGSRLEKVGAAQVDEVRQMIYQPIEGTTFPSISEITS